MTTDSTFITNEEGQTLLNRFQDLIKDTQFFDVIVGYFYSSGFHSLYPVLEKTEKIRILVGISTSKEIYDSLKSASDEKGLSLQFSHAEAKQIINYNVKKELEESEDKRHVEEIGGRCLDATKFYK